MGYVKYQLKIKIFRPEFPPSNRYVCITFLLPLLRPNHSHAVFQPTSLLHTIIMYTPFPCSCISHQYVSSSLNYIHMYIAPISVCLSKSILRYYTEETVHTEKTKDVLYVSRSHMQYAYMYVLCNNSYVTHVLNLSVHDIRQLASIYHPAEYAGSGANLSGKAINPQRRTEDVMYV